MKRIAFIVYCLGTLLMGCSQEQKTPQILTLQEALNAMINSQSFSNQTLKDQAQQLIEKAKNEGYAFITANKLFSLMQQDDSIILIDTSAIGHYLLGHLENAKTSEFAPYQPTTAQQWNGRDAQEIFQNKLGKNKKATLVFYDEGTTIENNRATSACLWAKKFGYERIYQLVGGLKKWRESHYPITQSKPQCCN